MIVIDPRLHRKGLRPCVTICFDNTVYIGVAWPHMQSYVYYSIIIDCVYYDVGNETTTEIIIVLYSVQGRSANTEVETCCLSEGERATLINEQRRRGVSLASVTV